MNLLFVADPIESFVIYKDTTFAMMREAQALERPFGQVGRSGDRCRA